MEYTLPSELGMTLPAGLNLHLVRGTYQTISVSPTTNVRLIAFHAEPGEVVGEDEEIKTIMDVEQFSGEPCIMIVLELQPKFVTRQNVENRLRPIGFWYPSRQSLIILQHPYLLLSLRLRAFLPPDDVPFAVNWSLGRQNLKKLSAAFCYKATWFYDENRHEKSAANAPFQLFLLVFLPLLIALPLTVIYGTWLLLLLSLLWAFCWSVGTFNTVEKWHPGGAVMLALLGYAQVLDEAEARAYIRKMMRYFDSGILSNMAGMAESKAPTGRL